jgi:hypothetical protein
MEGAESHIFLTHAVDLARPKKDFRSPMPT